MATRVLMVCLGNICRSPLAQGILKNKVDPKDITVDSAGTGAFHIGNGPDPRSIAVAQRHGLDISQQRARQFHPADFDAFNLILVMDRSNFDDIVAQANTREQQEKVHLILDFAQTDRSEVPDPYYGGKDDFEYVYQLLDQACDGVLEHLK